MFYVEFVSASEKHLLWLRKIIDNHLKITGHFCSNKKRILFQLKYAKKEAMEIITNMYYNPRVVCLSRKLAKIKKALAVEKKQQKVYRKAQVEKR